MTILILLATIALLPVVACTLLGGFVVAYIVWEDWAVRLHGGGKP